MKLYQSLLNFFGLALFIFPALFAAPTLASAPTVQERPPLAAVQTLPHGMTLLAGTQRASPEDPDNLSKNVVPDDDSKVVVLVPNASAHDGWWTEQYVQQLKDLGWVLTVDGPVMNGGFPILHRLRREIKKCQENMMVVSIGPNTAPLENSETGEFVIFDFDFILFQHSESGVCE